MRDFERRVTRLEKKVKRAREKTTPERLAELKAMSYADYLHTQEWYRRRAVALKYAENRCMLCNSPAALNVHHRTYERCPGQERCSDLIVLCVDCHTLFHQARKLSS